MLILWVMQGTCRNFKYFSDGVLDAILKVSDLCSFTPHEDLDQSEQPEPDCSYPLNGTRDLGEFCVWAACSPLSNPGPNSAKPCISSSMWQKHLKEEARARGYVGDSPTIFKSDNQLADLKLILFKNKRINYKNPPDLERTPSFEITGFVK